MPAREQAAAALSLGPTPLWDLARGEREWLIFKDRVYLLQSAGDGQAREEHHEGLARGERQGLEVILSGKTMTTQECESLSFLEERSLAHWIKANEEPETASNASLPGTRRKGKRRAAPYTRPGSRQKHSTLWENLATLASEALRQKYAVNVHTHPKHRLLQPIPPSILPSQGIKEQLPYRPQLAKAFPKPVIVSSGTCRIFARQKRADALEQPEYLHVAKGWYVLKETVNAADLEERLRAMRDGELARAMRVRQKANSSHAEKLPSVARGGLPQAQRIYLATAEHQKATFALAVEPFVIRKSGTYYPFPATTLYLDAHLTEGGVLIPGSARVDAAYHHPFAFSSGQMCYGSSERFARQGISFSRPVSTANAGELSNTISTLFDEAEKLLHLGYLDGVRPVKKLSRKRFKTWSASEVGESGWKIYRQ